MINTAWRLFYPWNTCAAGLFFVPCRGVDKRIENIDEKVRTVEDFSLLTAGRFPNTRNMKNKKRFLEFKGRGIMNILMINPAVPDTFWSFKHALKFIRKKAVLPPLGLLTVAAMLPEEWSKRVVDVNVTKLTDQDLAWADYAFISGMVVQRESARQIISRCKKAGLTVVAGGPLFTSEYRQFEEVDHFVLNEAELTLPPFLADLAKGCAKPVYQTSEFCDIRRTPAPLWELADMKRYASMSIQFSRGCPFNCDFCNVTALFGHHPRLKTADQIVSELNRLYNKGGAARFFLWTTISSATRNTSRRSFCRR